MTCFCSTLALSQPQLLRGQRVQAPNLVGFPGTWPPGHPPLMAPSDIMQPGSASLPESVRLLPLPPVRPPGLDPMSSQPPTPPVSFPAAHLPGGPGTPCSSALSTTDILTRHPGKSFFHGFCLLGHCLPLLPSPLPTWESLPRANEVRPLGLENAN